MDTLEIPLTLQETYVYYDGPVLYSASTADGKLLLVMAVDATDDHEIELAVAVTQQQLAALKRGDHDLRCAFDGSLGCATWKLMHSKQGTDVIPVTAGDVNEAWLTESGVMLLES